MEDGFEAGDARGEIGAGVALFGGGHGAEGVGLLTEEVQRARRSVIRAGREPAHLRDVEGKVAHVMDHEAGRRGEEFHGRGG